MGHHASQIAGSTPAPSILNRHGAGEARGAHNSEVTGSKPVAGILITIAPVHQGTLSNPFHRHGAEAARRAHNPEDVGSRPTAGIFYYKAHKRFQYFFLDASLL